MPRVPRVAESGPTYEERSKFKTKLYYFIVTTYKYLS